MNRRALLSTFGAGLLLAGCATISSSPVRLEPITPMGELEPLYAALAGKDALTIQVSSNGCTTKGDFVFYVERKAAGTTVSFARRTLDRCRSFAMGKTELSFTWTELGLEPRAPVFLLNPVAAWTGPGA
jgi:hypothetical protein